MSLNEKDMTYEHRNRHGHCPLDKKKGRNLIKKNYTKLI